MKQHIANLINYELDHFVIEQRDYHYVRNQLYRLLGLELDEPHLKPEMISYPAQALEPILDELEKKGVLDGSQIARDLFDAKIMNVFAKLPSDVENHFNQLYKHHKQRATTWYYNYMKYLNYIRTDRINKNVHFETSSTYGHLEITINLSKPEKDPKSIIKESQSQSTDYPKCVLCIENEGFSGHFQRESRDQHRLIEILLNHDTYYFQYSPYIYYNEHAIIINEEHRPMAINGRTFSNLLTLCDQFSTYFFGSNADLPIVGGSILSHDHYQGGRHVFPIERAKVLKTWEIHSMKLHILHWPLSTIRLEGEDKSQLIDFACLIFNRWKIYQNKDLNIISHTNQVSHHTITPIARKKSHIYQLDLILRNNLTSEKYPLGFFHPHEDKWHIKKENIGLIEAMGLAILPARLSYELEAVKAYLLDGKPLEGSSMIHQDWALKLAQKHVFTKDNIESIIQQEIGHVFEGVLEDCGVFKQDEKGMNAFVSWIEGSVL